MRNDVGIDIKPSLKIVLSSLISIDNNIKLLNENNKS